MVHLSASPVGVESEHHGDLQQSGRGRSEHRGGRGHRRRRGLGGGRVGDRDDRSLESGGLGGGRLLGRRRGSRTGGQQRAHANQAHRGHRQGRGHPQPDPGTGRRLGGSGCAGGCRLQESGQLRRGQLSGSGISEYVVDGGGNAVHQFRERQTTHGLADGPMLQGLDQLHDISGQGAFVVGRSHASQLGWMIHRVVDRIGTDAGVNDSCLVQRCQRPRQSGGVGLKGSGARFGAGSQPV